MLAGPPAADPGLAVEATFAGATEDPLEAAYAALPEELRAIGRDWVMRGRVQGETLPENASSFGRLFDSASDTERREFLKRRVPEPTLKAA